MAAPDDPPFTLIDFDEWIKTAPESAEADMGTNAQGNDAFVDWESIPNAEPRRSSEASPPAPLIKTSAEFISGYVPPDYTLDGMLQQGFLYSLTGTTGSGKTSIALRLAASTAMGIVFAGRATKTRRQISLTVKPW
jgi:hypothetical protein